MLYFCISELSRLAKPHIQHIIKKFLQLHQPTSNHPSNNYPKLDWDEVISNRISYYVWYLLFFNLEQLSAILVN